MNIEPIIIDYLKRKLVTDSVYGEIQEKPEEKYIVVDKTGSDTEDKVTTSTIAIQSTAPSKALASDTNEEVKDAMDEIIELPCIYDCQLMSDYNFTNVARKEHRYQSVFEITHR